MPNLLFSARGEIDILSPWLLIGALSKAWVAEFLEARVEKDSTPDGAVDASPKSVIAVNRLMMVFRELIISLCR